MPLQVTFFRCASCPPCDQQAAILDHVKREAPGDVEFRELHAHRDPDQAARYRVSSHPVLVLERNGVELRRWTTVASKLDLLAALREVQGPLVAGAPPVEVPSGPVAGQLPGKSQMDTPLPGPPMHPEQPGPGGPPGMP